MSTNKQYRGLSKVYNIVARYTELRLQPKSCKARLDQDNTTAIPLQNSSRKYKFLF